MRAIPVRAVILAVAAVQLGGCNSFLGIDFARHSAPAKEPAAATALVAAPMTEAGRKQLADGRTGLAVETFQVALGAGEPQAPALNGLGVAFARLGRYDLAHRFFSQAMALDPADNRYADNMTRLLRSPEMLAMRRDADIAARAQAELATPRAAAPAQAAKPEVGKIERLSRGEVRIVTAPPQARPVASTTRTASTKGSEPSVRIAFADKQPAENNGFVRIMLPEPTSAERAEAIIVSAAQQSADR